MPRLLLYPVALVSAVALAAGASTAQERTREPAPPVIQQTPAPAPAPVAVPRQAPAPPPAPAVTAPRAESGAGTRDRAVPRAPAGTADQQQIRSPRRETGGEGRTAGADQAQPRDSRSRGDRPVVGRAVPRAQAPVRPGQRIIVHPSRPFFGHPFGSRYGYGAFGLGYFYYPYAWGGYGYPAAVAYAPTGRVRLRVTPKDAQVFVNGYYVGIVDDFDGLFQRLRLESGAHRIEIRADGYEPLVFEVLVRPGGTVTYRGELQREQR